MSRIGVCDAHDTPYQGRRCPDCVRAEREAFALLRGRGWVPTALAIAGCVVAALAALVTGVVVVLREVDRHEARADRWGGA
jgi:hypothetical protein